MDPLSGGASVLAFVGLASQLAVGIKKLYAFWASIEDAPEDIRAIARSIRLIEEILEEISLEEETYLLQRTLRTALKECANTLEELNALVVDLEPGFASSKRRVRKWNGMKAVLRKDRIKKTQGYLSELKLSLSLSLQSSSIRKSRVQYETLTHQLSALYIGQVSNDIALPHASANRDQLATIPSLTQQRLSSLRNPIHQAGLSCLLDEALKHESLTTSISQQSEALDSFPRAEMIIREDVQPSLAQSQTSIAVVSTTTRTNRSKAICSRYHWSSIFGTVNIKRTTHLPMENHDSKQDKSFNPLNEETQTSISIQPSLWLISLGLSYQAHATISWSLNGWKLMQQPWRIVPSSNPIFHACRRGDLEQVKQLFSRKQASVWDVDVDGMTLLHHAAEEYHADVCKFLIVAGAKWKRDRSNFSPLTRAIYGENYDMVTFGDATSRSKLREQIDTQRLLLTSQPGDCVDEVLIFLSSDYFEAHAWPQTGASVVVKTLLESSEALKADIGSLVEASEDEDDMQDYLLIIRHIWRQSRIWKTPGIPEITAESYDKEIDVFAEKYGHPSILHSCIINKIPTVDSIMTSGAKLHLLSRSSRRNDYVDLGRHNAESFFKRWDSPTSLAMYTSSDFSYLEDAICKAGIYLPEFIHEELNHNLQNGFEKQKPLTASGWTEESLAYLFRQTFTPSTCMKACTCYTNWDLRTQDSTLKQPKWLRFLSLVKSLGKEVQRSAPGQPLDAFQSLLDGFFKSAFENLTDSEAPSPFCFPDHKGCYLCENCWYTNGYVQDFWSTRDIDPSYEVWSQEEMSNFDEEENSPFLLSFD